MVIEDRISMLEALQIEGRPCVEVGVLYGDFAQHILDRKPSVLSLVDPWMSQSRELWPDDPANMSQDQFDDAYAHIVNRFSSNESVRIYRETSFRGASLFKNESQYFVFIDAIHTFEAVLIDISMWYPKVEAGGWLCGHDYTGSYIGVRRAVDSFCKITGRKLDLVTTEPWGSWGIRK